MKQLSITPIKVRSFFPSFVVSVAIIILVLTGGALATGADQNEKENMPRQTANSSVSGDTASEPSVEAQTVSSSFSKQDRESIEAMKKIEKDLHDYHRFPWYNSAKKKMVFIPPQEEKETPLPEETESENRGLSVVQKFVWWLVILFLIAIATVIVWAVIRVIQTHQSQKKEGVKEEENQRRRMETLLPEVREEINTLLPATQRAIDEGRWRDALILYFSFILVELDKARKIVMQRGKTNHDYATELSRSPAELHDIYSAVMTLFEMCYYGTKPAGAAEFLPVWNQRARFLQLLAEPRQYQQPPMNPPYRPGGVPFVRLLLPAVLMLSLLSGCHKFWDDKYVEYLPYGYDSSMNGTVLFNELCKEKDNKCSETFRVPKELEEYDCIVWFYDSFFDMKTMDEKTAIWFTNWAREKPGRSLVLVDNAWFADVNYWTEIQKDVPQNYKPWTNQKLTEAEEREQIDIKRTKILNNLKKVLNQKKDGKDSGKEIYTIPPVKEMTKEVPGSQISPETNNYALSEEYNPFDESNTFRDTLSSEEKTDDNFAEKKDGPFEKNTGNSKELKPKVNSEKKPTEGVTPELQPEEEQKELWFTITSLEKTAIESRLSGMRYWHDNLPSGPDFRMTTRLTPKRGTVTLLRAGDMPLLCMREVNNGGKVYIVQSGCFLLNYPLLETRNQILAGRLLDKIGKDKKILIYYGEPFVKEMNATKREYNSRDVSSFSLTRWTPFAVLFWQVVLLAVIVCLWRFPILGRPKEIPVEDVADFGRHLTAYGEILRLTGNTEWAQEQIETFQKAERSLGTTLGTDNLTEK